MPDSPSAVVTFLYRLLAWRAPAWVRYAGTTAIVVLVLLLRLALPFPGFPFLLFVPALFLSAVLFGSGAGLYGTVLSAVLVAYFIIEPVYSFVVPGSQVFSIAVYVFVGACISLLCVALRALLDRAVAAEREKSLLLDELAHRTKNNLQMIASLLALQARGQPDPAARAALDSAVARVQVIARLHDTLQPGGRDAVVDMRDYLDGLCRALGETLAELRPVAVRVSAERVELDAVLAGPVGLIVNELVTNAFKYAFPDGRGGTIEVGFRRAPGARLELAVRDDGVGLPPGGAEGLGSRLTRMLVQQLDGDIVRADAGPGCAVAVTFPDPAAAERGRGSGREAIRPVRAGGPAGTAG